MKCFYSNNFLAVDTLVINNIVTFTYNTKYFIKKADRNLKWIHLMDDQHKTFQINTNTYIVYMCTLHIMYFTSVFECWY